MACSDLSHHTCAEPQLSRWTDLRNCCPLRVWCVGGLGRRGSVDDWGACRRWPSSQQLNLPATPHRRIVQLQVQAICVSPVDTCQLMRCTAIGAYSPQSLGVWQSSEASGKGQNTLWPCAAVCTLTCLLIMAHRWKDDSMAWQQPPAD